MMRSVILIPVLVAACSQPSPFTQPTTTAALLPGEADVLLRLSDYRPPGDFPDAILSLALSSDYLLFSSAHRGVYRMPKYGGAVEYVGPVDDSITPLLTVDNEQIYWLDGSDIMTRAVAGGKPRVFYHSALQLGTSLDLPSIMGDDKYLYVGMYERSHATDQPPDADVVRLPLDGSGPPVTLYKVHLDVVLGKPTFDPGGPSFIADGGDFFYLDPSGLELDVIPAGSLTPKTLATWSLGDVYRILTVHGGMVYLSAPRDAEGHGILLAVPRDGGAVTRVQLPVGADTARFFAVDDDRFYFVDASPDRIDWVMASMPIGGGPETRISRNDHQFADGIGPETLQDEKNLFFVHNYGEIVMLPKTPTEPVQ